MEKIIEIKNLSKRYWISHEPGGIYACASSLRDDVAGLFKVLAHRRKKTKEHIWALKDINLSIEQGEILGVIGHNGAGKSTFLKILTRITPPTKGEAIVRGRIGSLLEVGTGFHPELTGRENVYLNGAILGMKKKEIDKKFEEIVDFAGIRQFLDTPLKRYSTGMGVRLAFSIAANLDPEILLIDEVLSVGDAAFQKKSYDKMEEVTQKSGRTILFVSHNMGAIQGLCKRTVLLDKGQIVKVGPTEEVINYYLNSGNISSAEKIWEDQKTAPGDEFIKLHSARVCDDLGNLKESIDAKEPVNVEIEYWNLKPGAQRIAGVHFWNDKGVRMFISHDLDNKDWRSKVLPMGLVESVCHVPGNVFSDGRVFLTILLYTFDGIPLDNVTARNVISFRVMDDFENDVARADIYTHNSGVVNPKLKWSSAIIKS